MKRRTTIIISAIIIFLLFAIILLYFCLSSQKQNYHLNITATPWSESGSSQSSTQEFTVTVKDTVTFSEAASLSLRFQIIKGTKNSITIKTEEPMSLSETGTGSINLNSTETEFVIRKGNSIYLDTLTMDAGTSYQITLE